VRQKTIRIKYFVFFNSVPPEFHIFILSHSTNQFNLSHVLDVHHLDNEQKNLTIKTNSFIRRDYFLFGEAVQEEGFIHVSRRKK